MKRIAQILLVSAFLLPLICEGNQKEAHAYLTELRKHLSNKEHKKAANMFFVKEFNRFPKDKVPDLLKTMGDSLLKRIDKSLKGKVVVGTSDPILLPKNTPTLFCYYAKPERDRLGIALYRFKDRIGFGLLETFNQEEVDSAKLEGVEKKGENQESQPNGVTRITQKPSSPPAETGEKPAKRPAVIINDLKLKLVPITHGTFIIGSPSTELDRLKGYETQHKVTISRDFWMAETEITQAQYHAIAGKNPSYFISDTERSGEKILWNEPEENNSFFGGGEPKREKVKDKPKGDEKPTPFKGDPNRPVEKVSWLDAVAFCKALTKREAAKIPPGYVYRLPTDAEWEYCCRAGTTTNFSYGQDDTYTSLDKHAWYAKNSRSMTQPVGKKPANPWGLYDMHGNVWEWCYDRLAHYENKAQTDPAGPKEGDYRVVRGGGWGTFTGNYFRSAYRSDHVPQWRAGHDLGFRIVLAPVLPPK